MTIEEAKKILFPIYQNRLIFDKFKMYGCENAYRDNMTIEDAKNIITS